MKRYRPQLLLIFGAVLTMASIVWELVRMAPDTTYIVNPWALRGYQSVHGSVTFTIGAIALIYGLISMLDIALKPTWSRVMAVVMAAGVIAIAAIYGGPQRSMGGAVLGWVMAVIAGYIVAKAVRNVLPSSWHSSGKNLIQLATLVVASLLLSVLLFGSAHTAAPWFWIGIAALLALGLSITGRHPQLAANRMLMFLSAGGWLAIALSAAAARTSLLDAQVEKSIAETGSRLVADYKDVQVTSGYFVALFGMLIVVIGSISLWAKRRDIIINAERAERQRAAAEASAAEIKAALEIAQQHRARGESRPLGPTFRSCVHRAHMWA